jgi:hypothetical protein
MAEERSIMRVRLMWHTIEGWQHGSYFPSHAACDAYLASLPSALVAQQQWRVDNVSYQQIEQQLLGVSWR